jgi:uncharacterized protein with HXXEE motif
MEATNMQVPWVVIFWMMVAAYVVHVLDESLLGGSFVEKVREHWWPGYSWTKFFWFNTAYFVIMIASVVLYDLLAGFWIILPLAWLIERTCNGLWHLWWTVHFHEYSPGLVSSILMWMNFYFALRYTPTIPAPAIVVPAVVIGLAAATFLAFFIPLVKGQARTTVPRQAV